MVLYKKTFERVDLAIIELLRDWGSTHHIVCLTPNGMREKVVYFDGTWKLSKRYDWVKRVYFPDIPGLVYPDCLRPDKTKEQVEEELYCTAVDALKTGDMTLYYAAELVSEYLMRESESPQCTTSLCETRKPVEWVLSRISGKLLSSYPQIPDAIRRLWAKYQR